MLYQYKDIIGIYCRYIVEKKKQPTWYQINKNFTSTNYEAVFIIHKSKKDSNSRCAIV